MISNNQRTEINKAVYEYLKNNNFHKSAEIFEQEAEINQNTQVNGQFKDILEKKWVSIIKLQKRIMELEKEIEQLKEEQQNQSHFGNQLSYTFLHKDKHIYRYNSLTILDQQKKICKLSHIPKTPAKSTLKSQRAPITWMDFHPLYTIFASSSEDGTIKIWDFESGVLEKTLRGHTGAVNSVNFDSQGQYIISSSSDMSLKLWEIATFTCKQTMYGHAHTISHARFFPNGDHIVSCSRDKQIKIWEVKTGFCIQTIEQHDDWIRIIDINDQGTYIASSGNDQYINTYQGNPGNLQLQQKLIGHDHVVEILRFISNSLSQTIMQNAEFQSNGLQQEKAIPSNIELLLSGGRDRTIKLWNFQLNQCVHTFIGHDNWVRGLGIHISGEYMYSGADDKTIRVWSMKSGKCVRIIKDAHNHFITCLNFNQRYLVLVTGSFDSEIKVWEMR